ncbi:Fructose-1-phosphate phosphatase YqaB, partial [Haemophilus influenzae]
TRSN